MIILVSFELSNIFLASWVISKNSLELKTKLPYHVKLVRIGDTLNNKKKP